MIEGWDGRTRVLSRQVLRPGANLSLASIISPSETLRVTQHDIFERNPELIEYALEKLKDSGNMPTEKLPKPRSMDISSMVTKPDILSDEPLVANQSGSRLRPSEVRVIFSNLVGQFPWVAVISE